MAREYQRTVWQNEPNTSTPLDADNLNHIENGIYNLETKVENKVDKVNGKGLSTNDYTTAEKEKLTNINLTSYATKTYVDNSFTIAGKKSGTTLGTNATAEGTNNTVTGGYGHGEGKDNTASGYAAHAENYETTASGFYSHSQGYGTTANGESQHVAGKFNVADNNNTYAEIIGGGSSDDSRANIRTLDWNGNAKYSGNVYAQNNKILAKAEDVYTKSEVDAKVSSAYHPAGTKTVAQLTSSLLVAANIGNVYNITDSGTTTADFHEGSGKPIRAGDNVGICNFGTDSSPFILFDLLSGFVDTSEFATNSAVNTALSGKVDKVNGKGLSTNDYTTAEKEKLANINLTNYATKDYVDESYTIAGKAANTTVGSYSTAEGHNNTATGNNVHVEGYGNTATGGGNHAEGYGNTISGEYGHVEGTENTVSGYRTHVEGTGNIGSGYAQHVSGKYNVADNNDTYAEIVGGGEDSTHRANIRTLDWNGTGRYAGDLYVHDSRKVLDTNDKKEVASTFKDKYDESSIPSTYTTKYYSIGHPSTMYPAADYGSATTCCIDVKNGNWYSYTDSPDDAWVLEDELPLRGGGTADNLTDLGDVNINSPLGGQVLAYNNSQQKWYNKSLKEYGGVKEQAIDASETIYPLSKITSELELLLFRVDGQLHTGQYVYYVEAEGKYFVTDTNGKLFKSYWLHYNTQEEYYSEVNTNIEFTKFLWVSNDNIIGYSTDGYLYYASRNSAFNGNFTQSEEIGTNLDFVNFYEFDGYVYCVTNNSVWMSQTFGQTWMRIKTGSFTNSMCGGGILAYTTSTKVYVKCVGENDFKEYNLPITNGKTIYGKGLFICYTDGEIHVSYDGCRRWIEKQTFIKNGSAVYVSDLTDDLLIRYTKGIFGICNDNVWDLSFDFDNLIIISDYAKDDYVSLWCNYSDKKYVYDVDGFGEFYYGEYLTTNIPQKVENNLAELHDVGITAPANGQILKYNSTRNKWENTDDITVDSSMSTTSTNPIQNKVITGKIDNITSVSEISDTTPYLYKASEHDAVYDKLVGASFGINQLVQNGNFADASEWTKNNSNITFSVNNNIMTVDCSTSGDNNVRQIVTMIPNHKYLFLCDAKSSNTGAPLIYVYYGEVNNLFTKYPSGINIWEHYTSVFSCVSTTYNQIRLQNPVSGANNQYKNVMLIDLTLMFGSTIADYVYSLEQSSAGSGIAWLKSYGFFTKDYYPYNAGGLQSVKTSGKKVVGKNLVNANGTDTNNGYLNTRYIDVNGAYTSPNTYDGFITEYCKIMPNAECTISGISGGSPAICFYDENKTFISGIKYNNRTTFTFTTPNNASYFRASIPNVKKDTAQLELGSTATPYEPYTSTTYPLGNDELRGVLQLVSNQLVYDGDIKTSDGVISRRYGIVDLGSLTWSYTQSLMMETILGSSLNVKEGKAINGICQQYINAYTNSWTNVDDKQFGIIDGIMRIKDTSYTDATTFKTAMSGVCLVYELATPTTEQSTPFTSPQIVYSDGTEEYIDTRDVPIPVGHESEYIDIPEWMDNKYFNDVRWQASEGENTKQIVNIINSRTRNNITNRLADLPKAVAEQNLGKYGYKIGDYFERVDGNRTYTYHIADPNTFKGTSTPYCLTENHYTIAVDTHSTSQWYSGDASAVGYNGSTLHTYLKGTVLDNIKADMIYFFGGTTGLEHLLSHSKLLTTALANWGWQANQYISALSEVQTIGSTVWSANGYQTGEASKKLELFDKYKWTEIFEGRYPWLRDLYTSSLACVLTAGGYATDNGVTISYYAVGLINFY